MKSCLVHPDCTATIKVDGIPICLECWDNASLKEREWFKRTIYLYNQGLITMKELENNLFCIGYHELDPTVPVHI